jgi:hypothetical protein
MILSPKGLGKYSEVMKQVSKVLKIIFKDENRGLQDRKNYGTINLGLRDLG